MSTNEYLSKPKIQLNGVSHFALNVNNMEQAEKFYTHIMDFPFLTRSNTKAGQQHIEVDAGNLTIALFESPELELQAAHKTMRDDRYLHLAFNAPYDRFNEALLRLKNDGVNIDGEPRDWGKSISIYFRDPDGHQLEINFTK